MMCVSRWAATKLGALFTFAAATCLSCAVTGCGTETIRVPLRHDGLSRPSLHVAAATPSVGSVAQLSVPPPSTTPNRLSLLAVPNIHLTVPWEVRFSPHCFVDVAEKANPSAVDVAGDLDAPGYVLRVKLDAALSRTVPARRAERQVLTLTDLVDPWTGIRQGRHRLIAFAARAKDGQIPLDDSGKPAVSFCEFQVDASGRLRSIEAHTDVVLLGVEGTIHGAVSEQLLIGLFRASADSGGDWQKPAVETNVRLVVEHPDGEQDRHLLDYGTYRVVSVGDASLAAGDYAMWATLIAASTPHSASNLVSDTSALHEFSAPWLKHIVTVNP